MNVRKRHKPSETAGIAAAESGGATAATSGSETYTHTVKRCVSDPDPGAGQAGVRPATQQIRKGHSRLTANDDDDQRSDGRPVNQTATRNPRYANGHRRRRLRTQVLAEEDCCAICGTFVDKDLPHLDAWAPVIDEIVPVSKGGNPYDRNNVRLCHRLCNARRGNGTRQRAVIVPYVTSRQW